MMNKPFRACSCRAPATAGPDGATKRGKLLGRSCPKLKTDSRHGSWYVRFDAPAGPDGKRRQPRIGPYDTQGEASDALVEALGQAKKGAVPDRKLTVGQYLAGWLEDVRPNLKPRTWASYEEAVRLYFAPGIGHHKLADLRDRHIRALYASMRKINRPEAEGSNDEMLRRLLAARREILHLPGVRWGTKPVGEAGIKRRHVVLVAALYDAVERRLIASNPASAIKFRLRKVRPLLWTAPRVERWRETGRRPTVVMVWSPEIAGAFLDSIEDDRLYPLYHLACYWGLRRSELAGLEWADADLEARRLHVRQAQAAGELDDTKSEDGNRIIKIDKGTAAVLKAWRKQELRERIAWGKAWQDSGRVFTREDGSPLRPAFISEHFKVLYRPAGLPPVRFHDLRHGSASMLLAAGVELKVVSETMGHSTSSFTADVYVTVLEEMSEAAAAAIEAFVPRKRRTETAVT